MCVCSGKYRAPCPRSSTSAASAPGSMASCVGNIATPVSIAARLHPEMPLEAAHPAQPALVVAAAVGHIGADLGVGEDEEALLADRGDHHVGDLLGLEDGRDLLELLDRQLAVRDHRRAHVLR